MLDCARARARGDDCCGSSRVGGRQAGSGDSRGGSGWAKRARTGGRKHGSELLRLRGPEPAWGYHRAGSGRSRADGAGMPGVARDPRRDRRDFRFEHGLGRQGSIRRGGDGHRGVFRLAGEDPAARRSAWPFADAACAGLDHAAGPAALAGGGRSRSPRPAGGRVAALSQEGEQMSPADDPDHIVGHDTMLVGWPWVAGTHSWLEPTALAVLALRRAGLGTNPRVVEGYRLIRDRAIVTGGWNYGNKSAFGHPLRPQPAPTGLALLALAHARRTDAHRRARDPLSARDVARRSCVRLAGLGVTRFAGLVERSGPGRSTGWPRPTGGPRVGPTPRRNYPCS